MIGILTSLLLGPWSYSAFAEDPAPPLAPKPSLATYQAVFPAIPKPKPQSTEKPREAANRPKTEVPATHKLKADPPVTPSETRTTPPTTPIAQVHFRVDRYGRTWSDTDESNLDRWISIVNAGTPVTQAEPRTFWSYRKVAGRRVSSLADCPPGRT